jgi:hypothetical protein
VLVGLRVSAASRGMRMSKAQWKQRDCFAEGEAYALGSFGGNGSPDPERIMAWDRNRAGDCVLGAC